MRKSIALFVLIVMFIPLAFAAMTLIAIRPRVLDRGFYEDMLNDEALYQALLTEEIPWRFNRDSFTLQEELPTEALAIALREVLPADYLRTQSLHVVDQVFDYLEGRDRDIELSLDITPIKNTLLGEGQTRFAAALAAALPACLDGQQPIAPTGRLTRCIALEDSVGAAAEQIAGALPAVIDNTPDRIIFSDDTAYAGGTWAYFAWLPGAGVLAVLDLAILMTIGTTVVAGFVGAFLGGDDLHGRLKWSSAALFFPGSLFLAGGLALTSPYLVEQLGYSLNALRYSEAFREAMSHVVGQVIQQIGSGVLLTGLIACLIAFGLLILSLATRGSDQQSPRMVQVPVQNG